jgi:hypothetical protein
LRGLLIAYTARAEELAEGMLAESLLKTLGNTTR